MIYFIVISFVRLYEYILYAGLSILNTMMKLPILLVLTYYDWDA